MRELAHSFRRVLIRRLHAYQFLRDHPELAELDPDLDPAPVPTGETTAEGQPIYAVDGSKLPIPGIVLLGPDGRARAFARLGGRGARGALVAALRQSIPPAGS